MKISSRGRYALRMMIDIAENSVGEWVPIKEISERQGISLKYLEQIVTSLTRAGLLRSGRGPQGGYALARSTENYTVGEIIRAIEGKLAPVACLDEEINLCERKEHCKTLDFWRGLYETVNNYMDSVTLKELVDSSQEEI